jgi:hypothetical protein
MRVFRSTTPQPAANLRADFEGSASRPGEMFVVFAGCIYTHTSSKTLSLLNTTSYKHQTYMLYV